MKMQNDKMTEFDLRIKAMLEDAQEEVPAGVWSAVEERIARPKRVVLTWRRAAVSFAVAAALAVAVIIPSHIDRGTQDVLVAGTDIVADIEDQIENSLTLLADIPSNPVRKSRTTASVPAEMTAPEVLENETAPAVEEVRKPGNRTAATRQEEDWSDPFDSIEDETIPDRLIDRLSFSLQGNLADNDKAAKSPAPNRAPGSSAIVKTGVTEKSQSTYGVPVTWGIGARYRLNDRFSIGTGINYTLLSRSFTGMYNEVSPEGVLTKSISTDIYNEIHYVGIPLNVYCNLLESGNLDFYVYAGGSVEKGLSNNYKIKSEPTWFWYRESVPGVQVSAAAGLGLGFDITRHLALYLDPSIRYYFDCGQPNSVRTSKPYMFNFEVGFRFNLGR